MAKAKLQSTTSDQLCDDLRGDLKKLGSANFQEVVNDVPRKTFTAKITGAIMDFPHKQPDQAFWCGVKYYGSGSSSKVRMRRTPKPVTEKAAPSKKEAAVALVTE